MRVKAVRNHLDGAKLDAVLITSADNRFYLSGFRGSAGALLISAEKNLILVDFRYTEQAKKQAPAFEVRQYKNMMAELGDLCDSLNIRRLGFEADDVSYKQYRDYEEKLDGVELVPVERLVEDMRAVKDPDEIEAIRRAVAITDRAFEYIRGWMRPGMSELDVAMELEFFMRKQGAESMAFAPIVAAGERGALPHAAPGKKQLEPGDMVVMDFGALADGYCADMTRTVILGEPDPRQRAVYELVLGAQQLGVDAVCAGRSSREVDNAARQFIADAGYGDNFGHGLGHGVGVAVHELPSLSPNQETRLKPGMVVTVEPGVYIPGWGGVRIEDMVLVTETGCEILTGADKQLESVTIMHTVEGEEV